MSTHHDFQNAPHVVAREVDVLVDQLQEVDLRTDGELRWRVIVRSGLLGTWNREKRGVNSANCIFATGREAERLQQRRIDKDRCLCLQKQ